MGLSTLTGRVPATWTLRARLVVILVAVVATVSLIVGLVSVLSLSGFLNRRLDAQLTDVVNRTNTYRPPDPGEDDYGRARSGQGPSYSPCPGTDSATLSNLLGRGGLFPPGQAAGTLRAAVAGGQVVQAAVLDRNGCPSLLTPEQAAPLATLPADNHLRTVDLGDLGDYRVIGWQAPSGETSVNGLPAADVQQTVYQLALVITIVALIALAAAAAAGAVIIRLALRPLRRVAATAGRVAELPLERGEVALAVRVPEQDTDPRTEVGQVGAALNRMIGHVGRALVVRQASEARVRRFVSDASHELRTPLASIRGYAELTRRSGADVPPEVAFAVARVESEAQRMTGLVEDLLLLARLDEGRPVERQPLDLSELVVVTVSDARAAGPDHRWHLDLPEQPVTVIGDPARCHQVVANLLANARSHTPPGTTVRVVLRARPAPGPAGGGEAVLTVTDDGPGIPPALLPEVFERFARGDSSRSRAAGSTGLGLAIVAAVVEAHHGRIEVSSRPGRTTFTVHLPLAVPRAVEPADSGAVSPAAVTLDLSAPSAAPSAGPPAGRSAARRGTPSTAPARQ
jgi:two-component system OmpR family sensor kinase